jgi:adenylate cyclase
MEQPRSILGLERIRPILQALYNQVLPLLLMIVGLLALWMICASTEPVVFDKMMRLFAASPRPQSPVVLVLVDDSSVLSLAKRFGRPPWSRQVYVDIFSRLERYEPRVVVFDGHFTPMAQDDDVSIYNTLKTFPNLIIGLAVSADRHMNTRHPGFYQLNVGVVNTEPDESDGIVRRLKPVWTPLRTKDASHPEQSRLAPTGVYPSLALAAALEYLNQPGKPVSGKTELGAHWSLSPSADRQKLLLVPDAMPEQTIQLPLDPQGNLLLRWYRPLSASADESPEDVIRSHVAIPLRQLFDDRYEAKMRGLLAGKIVVFGSSSSLFRDYHPTPISLRHLGADIHATAIDNILSGQVLYPIPFGIRWLVLVLLVAAIIIIRVRQETFARAVLYTGCLMILYFWFALSELVYSHRVWDLVTPEVFMLIGLLAGTVWWAGSRTRQIRKLERTIAQLVSPSVFREIQRRHGRTLAPGGERQEITSMMVDIRDFTSLAENLPSTEVTELLNAFYTVVEQAIFNYRGTVDKYMGDGVLIMFGAPLPMAHHADVALAAAIEVIRATDALSELWSQERHIRFEVGVSINSGQAFVGFLGPPNKLEYTAVGDTVNLCVRLQEHNKRFHTRLIVSEYTAQWLSQWPEELMELGEVRVRGRESLIKVYTTNEMLDPMHHLLQSAPSLPVAEAN